jgi:hypothetical protein
MFLVSKVLTLRSGNFLLFFSSALLFQERSCVARTLGIVPTSNQYSGIVLASLKISECWRDLPAEKRAFPTQSTPQDTATFSARKLAWLKFFLRK